MNTPHAPLRIALATQSLARAGAEKQFVYIARALHEAGVDVRVFYFGTGGFYETVLRSIPIPVYDVAHKNQPIRVLSAMVKALRSFRPHILIASQFGDILYAGIAGRVSGALTIAGVRSDGFWEMNEYRHRMWLMRRLPHALVANSYRARLNLASMGIGHQNVKILTNVIDLQEYDHRSASASPIPVAADRVVVAAIGRLNRDKRFDRVLDVLALLRNANPLVTGVIVGRDQGAKAWLEERANVLGLLPGRLVFMGESDNVPALLKNCDILLHTSDYEGFPNTILEAMAARLPIVTTPAGDCPRLVENGRTGYVVDFENTKGMAELVLQLAQSPEQRRQMGEAGRRQVEEEHDFPHLSKRLFGILQELARQKRRPALLPFLDCFQPGREFSPAYKSVLEKVLKSDLPVYSL